MPIEVIYPRKANESAKDYSYKNLLFNIATNVLPPGAAIEEAHIANKLHVSRTPVREAILRLNRERFIDILPQKSTTVSLVDVDFIEQGLFTLHAIEKSMITTCSHNLDSEDIQKMEAMGEDLSKYLEHEDHLSFFNILYTFHFMLFKGCKKEKVYGVLEFFYYHVLREVMVALDVFPLNPIIDDIKHMSEAFKNKDVKNALMYHTFHMEHLTCDHEILKTAHPSYFYHM